MKILIIDNLFEPNKAGIILNGAQKFTRNQMTLLSEVADTYYATAEGSDKQYNNQFILNNHFNVNLPDIKDKIKQTKAVTKELIKIINEVNPDVVLDSCGKQLSNLWDHYSTGIMFEHYCSASMPLNDKVRNNFLKKNVYWVGVSKHQNSKFGYSFHDIISIHYINEYPEQIKPAKPYGIFVSRWDGGKYPHTALKYYAKSGSEYPVKCFIRFGGLKIPEKELASLQQNPLFEFHIDAPRSQILECMSEAMFGLGACKESTGIVSLEYATYGVPYVVPGTGQIAEMEHMPKGSLFLADRNIDTPLPEQILAHVKTCSTWTLENRQNLSNTVIQKYNKQHFIDEHMRIINNAKQKFSKGILYGL